MIKNLLVIFAMVCGSVAMAQENHFMLQTKFGAFMPLGLYSTEAYATDGFGATVEAAYLFAGKKISLGPVVSIGFFDNAIDSQRAYDNDDLNIVAKDAYSNVYIGLGYMANLYLTQKFALTGQILAGALNSTSPKMLVGAGGMVFTIPEYNSTAFALRPAVGVKFYPGKTLILSADLEAIVAEQDFGQKQQIGVFNINAGIGVRF